MGHLVRQDDRRRHAGTIGRRQSRTRRGAGSSGARRSGIASFPCRRDGGADTSRSGVRGPIARCGRPPGDTTPHRRVQWGRSSNPCARAETDGMRRKRGRRLPGHRGGHRDHGRWPRHAAPPADRAAEPGQPDPAHHPSARPVARECAVGDPGTAAGGANVRAEATPGTCARGPVTGHGASPRMVGPSMSPSGSAGVATTARCAAGIRGGPRSGYARRAGHRVRGGPPSTGEGFLVGDDLRRCRMDARVTSGAARREIDPGRTERPTR